MAACVLMSARPLHPRWTIGHGCALVAALLLGGVPHASAAPLGPALARAPLDPPLTINGGFGDYRRGHFHAGFDLGTNRRVGKPVRAPESGWVERVRASGVGYGRSLYLRSRDGRTFQLGHLDAFASAIDRYVRAAQDSTGHYEQDLWPEPNRMPVRAGQVVAWSGESGAGGPHLHFEIRRGDFALHPQRAGLVVRDRSAPTIPRVTLEPLDAASSVAGGAGPVTIALAARADTVRAIGRIRAIVDARDGTWSGVDRMVPWSVGISWQGRTTECRLDSVSWATDMVEGDYVHDAGRITGGRALVLWAPAGWRPRFLRSDAPLSEEAGTLVVTPGDSPRALEIWARDAAGRETRRTVVLRAGPAPAPASPAWWGGGANASLPGGFTSLPGGGFRWSLPVPPARGGVEFQAGTHSRRALRAGDQWHAMFPNPWDASGRVARVALAARITADGAAPREAGSSVLGARLSPRDSLELADEGKRLRVPAGALFETGFVFVDRGAAPGPAAGLHYLGQVWRVEPSSLPLRRAARVTFSLPAGQPLEGVGVYRRESGGWQWVGAERGDAGRSVAGESRQLGAFALFRDVTPPRVALQRPPRSAATKPYSRWALEASVAEEGSGVDARASWLEVDGARVPTEWDPEARRLRWRPIRPPGPGSYRVLVVAADRAGNTTRETASFRMSR